MKTKARGMSVIQPPTELATRPTKVKFIYNMYMMNNFKTPCSSQFKCSRDASKRHL